MLQMNQNIIDKFSSFKKDQSTNENPPDINALKDVTNIQVIYFLVYFLWLEILVKLFRSQISNLKDLQN